jgi:hypothetical protein
MYSDTPLPQEEPAGQNPPDGAVLDYYLADKATNLSLEILDDKGTLIRKYTSSDTLYKIPAVNIPHYWIRPQKILSVEPGSHRFLWDMHYTPLNVPPSYPISAIYENTAPQETSPWVTPGTYTVRLTADGKTVSQKFVVKMDPRVTTTKKDLQLQHDLSLSAYNHIQQCIKALSEMVDKNSAKAKELSKYKSSFERIQNSLQESDMPPTTQMIKAAKETTNSFNKFYSTLK